MSYRTWSHDYKISKVRTKDASRHWLVRLQRSWRSGLHRHFQAAFLSLSQLANKPLTSSLICMVIAIALALPAGLYVMLENTKALSAGWEGNPPIMLYLTKKVTEPRIKALVAEIKARPEIEKVDYVSPETGLAEFQHQSGLGDILATLKENPLPGLLIVTPASHWQTPEAMEILLNGFKTLAEVDMAQFDLDWVQRLDAILNLSNHIIYALSILLGLGVIFVVGSTIHLATQNHKDEIFVFQLLGASKSFIRRPFLYSGMWYGLFGGLLACILMSVFFYWIDEPSKLLGQLYGGTLVIKGLSLTNILSLLGIGALLGVLGSWVVLYRHLAR